MPKKKTILAKSGSSTDINENSWATLLELNAGRFGIHSAQDYVWLCGFEKGKIKRVRKQVEEVNENGQIISFVNGTRKLQYYGPGAFYDSYLALGTDRKILIQKGLTLSEKRL